MKNILGIIVLFLGVNAFAQQDVVYTMYWNNFSTYNPAATGIGYKHYAALVGQNRWKEFDGATFNALYNTKFDKINSGFGLDYTYDRFFIETVNSVKLNYSYQIQLKKERLLGLGIAFDMGKSVSDYSKLQKFNVLGSNLPVGEETTYLFDMNIGAFYQGSRVSLGASVVNLLEVDPNYGARHCFVNFSYGIPAGANFEFRPGISYMTGLSALENQIDLNIRTTYKEKYSFGFAYQSSSGNDFESRVFAIYAGVDIKKRYRLAYAYNFHEIIYDSSEICVALMLE